jgi:hypothetical protein
MADAATMNARWKRNTAGAGTSYKEGVSKVRVSPMEQAAAQQDAMLRNLTDAVTSGRWAARLRSKTLGQWQQITSTKGATNYQTGVSQQSASDAQLAFANVWAPLMNSVSDAAKQIDKSTEAGQLARVALVIRAGKQYKQQRSGGGY